MGHPPIIGRRSIRDEINALGMPGGEVLGTVTPELTPPGPQTPPATQWVGRDGASLAVTDEIPPWELEDRSIADSDARRFVDYPAHLTVRWANPKYVEREGWNYWRQLSPEMAGVRLKVPSMLAPDGTIRRGGAAGDILTYMPTEWVRKRRILLAQRTQELTGSAVTKQDDLREEINRGKYGPYVHVESARHPTHTMAEGKSLQQDL